MIRPKHLGWSFLAGSWVCAAVGAFGEGIGATLVVSGLLFMLTLIALLLPRPVVPKMSDQVLLEKAKSVTLDINGFGKIRELEKEAYGHYYHRKDGTTNELGWEPVEDEPVAASKMGEDDWRITSMVEHRNTRGHAVLITEERNFPNGLHQTRTRTLSAQEYTEMCRQRVNASLRADRHARMFGI